MSFFNETTFSDHISLIEMKCQMRASALNFFQLNNFFWHISRIENCLIVRNPFNWRASACFFNYSKQLLLICFSILFPNETQSGMFNRQKCHSICELQRWVFSAPRASPREFRPAAHRRRWQFCLWFELAAMLAQEQRHLKRSKTKTKTKTKQLELFQFFFFFFFFFFFDTYPRQWIPSPSRLKQ